MALSQYMLPLRLFVWAALPALIVPAWASPQVARVVLRGSTPDALQGQIRGRLPAATPVDAAFTLPLRDPDGLKRFLARVADPSDPLYGHFLSPAQFTARFGPTQASYDAVATFARAHGLSVTGVHANRLLLDVGGSSLAMEKAFQVHLNRYRAADGHLFRAPDTDPSVPSTLTGLVSGVVGLSSASIRHPYNVRRPDTVLSKAIGGTGPEGGLAPADIRAAYNLSNVALSGSGQTLALFELDGYTTSDIRAYESRFGFASAPLQNVLVDGASGGAGTDSDEVTLDIELQNALAPGAAKILVYETTNTDKGTLDGYSRIADDDLAQQVSTSWGLDEPDNSASFIQSENPIFQQMAAQGQTIYGAAGDNGAFDSGSMSDGRTVDDPGSQPYVCSVGGTTLMTTRVGGPYFSETTWNSGSLSNGAGGGGVSRVWPIPTWQQGAVTSSVGGSQTMRNVPDVALNADPNTGYAIYYKGAWSVYGGCSCASPLWAGFTALVNQQRALSGLSTLGQVSPKLYPILGEAAYTSDFHDIANGSTNLYYPAVTGYDDATGLGTFNGADLLANLSATAAPTTPAHSWTATAIVAGPDGKTRILWDNADGSMTLWMLNADGSVASYGSTYGPLAGWTAKALSVGSDNAARVLWTNTNGAMTVWTFAAAGAAPSYGPVYGPLSGWTAIGIATDTGNATHVLWDNTNGSMTLWTLPSNGSPTYSPVFGPITGWTAKAVATDQNNTARVLWDNTGGAMTVWTIAASGSASYGPVYGPLSGWSAVGLSVDTSGASHVLWDNTNGSMTLWTLPSSGSPTYSPVFGPYSGWSAVGLSVGTNGDSHVLWDNTNGQMTPWTLDANDASVGTFPTYGPY